MAFASTSLNSFEFYRKRYVHYEQSQFSSVSMLALNYQATDRIKSLAKPKLRRETTLRDGIVIVFV